MCTVSFVPINKEQFVFTSNRDEAPKRNASELVKKMQNGKEILYPRDTGANGTWIALSNENQFVCILNGAFKKHKRELPYRLSRGIMALEFFNYKGSEDFLNNYNFENIEPFTMIIYDKGELIELRWDSQLRHIKYLKTSENYIWSSCTLYPDSWVEKRQEWFAEFLEANKLISPESILAFHKFAGVGDKEYDLVMNRSNIVRTISVSSIVHDNINLQLRYEDLLKDKIHSDQLEIGVYV